MDPKIGPTPRRGRSKGRLRGGMTLASHADSPTALLTSWCKGESARMIHCAREAKIEHVVDVLRWDDISCASQEQRLRQRADARHERAESGAYLPHHARGTGGKTGLSSVPERKM